MRKINDGLKNYTRSRKKRMKRGMCLYGGCFYAAMPGMVYCRFHSSSKRRRKKR
jgi:hypothetical protein